MSTLKRKFGVVGEALASALPFFSLDLCGVVASYAVYRTASEGAQPVYLYDIAIGSSQDGVSSCRQVACSPDDLIYCSSEKTVQVFTPEGQLLHTAPPHAFEGPAGIAFDNGQVFVVDYKGNSIVVCRPDCTVIRKFGMRGAGQGMLDWPWGIACDGKGLLHISDLGNSRIQTFTREGVFVRAWGAKGMSDGQLREPAGLMLNADGSELWVCDRSNDRVQVFTPEGKFLRKFGSKGRATQQFDWTEGLCFDRDGQVLVCDFDNHRVQCYSSDCRFLTSFGKHGKTSGSFVYVFSVCVDGSGRVFVGDCNGHVQVFAFM